MDHVEEPPGARTPLPSGARGLATRAYRRIARWLPLLRTVGFVAAVAIVVAMGVGAAGAVPVVASRFTASRSRIAPQRTSRATLNYLIAFAGYMAAAVLVQGAISGWHDLATVAGAACLSWAAGLVVVIAPSGVGAREWV